MSNQHQARESWVDVLVIGAGPAGVMACNALARNGVNVRIIDQRPVKVPAGQADGIQPRTIEVFQSYGLADRLLKEGNQMHMAAFYNPGPNGGIQLTERAPDVTAASARFPFEITLHQGAIEAIFLDSMRSLNVEVERPVVPNSIEISADHAILNDPKAYAVKTVLKHADKALEEQTEIVHSKFVVGADGAHSWVRKSLNIPMEGEQTDYVWGVIDMIPDTDFPDIRKKSVIHSNNGSCMIIPREGDMVRIYIQLEDKAVTTNGRVDKSKVGPLQLLEVARKSFHPYYFGTPEKFDWFTIYIIGQRVASKFSVKDRVFIAGDACHTHSPKAGQGMNASMNDSHNLAWKLTHVLKGYAKPILLKTYEFERRKYAQDLIDFDKQFARLFSGKPRTKPNEDGVSHEEFLQAFQTFGGFTSGIGICYAESVITNTTHQSIASNLTIGQRLLPQVFLRAADGRPYEIQDLLPSDGRFKLLVFSGDTTQGGPLQKLMAFSTALKITLSTLFSEEKISEIVDIHVINSATKVTVNHNRIPEFLRSHWSKVLIDDVDVLNRQGGGGYAKYGIGAEGALVIVRPDGYVGIIVPLEKVEEVKSYFAQFV
ncbi:FAD binding domain-containing protein [Panaeolus papilionaceus]|nr:FAD binding domain-containing protein [Panaeolus papilionaceus]